MVDQAMWADQRKLTFVQARRASRDFQEVLCRRFHV